MKNLKLLSLRAAIIITLGVVSFAATQARAASAAAIDTASRAALRDLYAANSKAHAIGMQAIAVLVFPSITKAGFVVAAQHGDGALITKHGTAGYYNTVAASYGLQAGLQKFGYALFFINRRAMNHLHERGGWALGSAPTEERFRCLTRR